MHEHCNARTRPERLWFKRIVHRFRAVEEIQRAVQSVEFMTARGAGLTYESLEHASSRILNKISGISHISHDISSKTPATIQWE